MGKTAYLFPNPETTARYLPYVAQFFAPADFVPACVVAVDIATPDLFPQGFSGAVDLCVDHHPSNRLYAGDTLLHAEKSACGEAVLELIELLTGSVTEQEANLLYIAVTTDTGCFQYANTNAATLPGRADGVVVSVTIRELTDGRSKISVRTTPEVDSCAICAVYGGGGHKMASGCTLTCDPETAVEKILAAIDQVWPA